MASEFLDVNPRRLRLYGRSISGADPWRLQIEIARFGRSLVGMPAIQVYRGQDGLLLIYDGVTRATRAAKLCPGQLVPVEVIGTVPLNGADYPSVEEKLP